MKLLILCSEQKRDQGEGVQELLGGLDVSIQLKTFRPAWDLLEGSCFVEDLEACSHLLILPDEASFRSAWLSFVLGYAMGGDKNLYLYGELDDLILPDWIRGLQKCQDPEELKLYYQQEILSWDKKVQRETARQAIAEAGYALSEVAFSDRVAEGDRQMVQLYLRAGFSAGARDDKGVPLLCTAVRKRHKILIPLLLNHGADINAQDDGRLNTPLMDAAADGLDEIVEMLLEAGANPDLISRNGQTALILAIGQGHTASSELLIRAGADTQVVDKLGMTALKYAKLFKNEKLIELIEEKE